MPSRDRKENSLWISGSICVRVESTLPARIPSVRSYIVGKDNSIWGTRIWGPFASKPIRWSVTNRNRAGRKHGFLRYLDAGKTNLAVKNLETLSVNREPMEIEIFRKGCIRSDSSRGIWISGPANHKSPLVDREPMKIEFARNMFFCDIVVRETWIRCPNTLETHWSIINEWK